MSEDLVAYVESAAEQHAFLLSRLGPQETWSVVEQRLATGAAGEAVEHATVRTERGMVDVEFREACAFSIVTDEIEPIDHPGRVDSVMQRAAAFAIENPPHHPGSLPRFPVPIEHYHQAVAVPFPILAVDDSGERGLFAPPRMAVMSWMSMDPVGVRELDGFDPGRWPPARLGDWPAPSMADMTPEVLNASVERFGACWSRVIDTWFGIERRSEQADVSLASDVRDAARLRAILDLPAMGDIYTSMNPRFAEWLTANCRREDR